MKANIKTLKAKGNNLSQYDIEVLETELRESLNWLLTMWHPRKDTTKAQRQGMIDEVKEFLGE